MIVIVDETFLKSVVILPDGESFSREYPFTAWGDDDHSAALDHIVGVIVQLRSIAPIKVQVGCDRDRGLETFLPPLADYLASEVLDMEGITVSPKDLN